MPKEEPRDRQVTQTVQRTRDRRSDLVAGTHSRTLWVVPKVSLVGRTVEQTLEARKVSSGDNPLLELKEVPRISLEAEQIVERILQVPKGSLEGNR